MNRQYKNRMNINTDDWTKNVLEEIRQMEYPRQIDLSNQVMQRISNINILPVQKSNHRLKRVGIIAAASFLVMLMTNISIFVFKDFDNPSVRTMIAEVYDYDSYSQRQSSTLELLDDLLTEEQQ